jgi:hypothetical protein
MLDNQNFWTNKRCTFNITLRDAMHVLHSSKGLTEKNAVEIQPANPASGPERNSKTPKN